MKQLTYIFFGMSLLLSSTLCAQAPVDYPLDTINGKIYYRYTVERGIGLYRISKNLAKRIFPRPIPISKPMGYVSMR